MIRVVAGMSCTASMGPQLYSCGNLDPCKRCNYHAVLQWGHNFTVAEIAHHTLQFLIHLIASMGPQLYSCGNSCVDMSLCHASIRLQWGHNFTVAEIADMDKKLNYLTQRFNGATTLQLRKYRRPRHEYPRISCFNGATTLQLRKSQHTDNYKLTYQRFNGATTLQLRKYVWQK